MSSPQSGIFALGTASDAYLEFDVSSGRPGTELVPAIAALREPRTTMGGVNLVAGFRPELWREVAPDEAPAELEGFWATTDRLVVTVSDDLDRAQLLAVARSLTPWQGTAAAPSSVAPARCKTRQLKLSGRLQGATQSLLGTLTLANRGTRACALPVAPRRVSLVVGTQVLPTLTVRMSAGRRRREHPRDASPDAAGYASGSSGATGAARRVETCTRRSCSRSSRRSYRERRSASCERRPAWITASRRGWPSAASSRRASGRPPGSRAPGATPWRRVSGPS